MAALTGVLWGWSCAAVCLHWHRGAAFLPVFCLEEGPRRGLRVTLPWCQGSRAVVQ